jgi:tetratricopeptide (TPR) repeat protein
MARHPTVRRVQREAEPDDAFVANILRTSAWAKTHARTLILGAVALVMLVGGSLYYMSYRRAVASEAEMRLTEVRQTAAAGNNALAISDLERLLTNFGGTPAATEARVLLAILYLDENNPTRATEVVEPVSRDPAQPLGASAAFLLGAAYEAQGQPERAEAVFLRIADRARLSYERRDALESAARLRMERGDMAGAVTLYDRLIGMTEEDSPDRSIYEMRRAEAVALGSAPAAVPAATPSPGREEAPRPTEPGS